MLSSPLAAMVLRPEKNNVINHFAQYFSVQFYYHKNMKQPTSKIKLLNFEAFPYWVPNWFLDMK